MIERLRTPLFAAIAVCGLLIALLSFGPWVRFHSLPPDQTNVLGGVPAVPEASVRISGTHLSRWRDLESVEAADVKEENNWCSCRVSIGDGYLTALLGLIVAASAGIALATWRDTVVSVAALPAAIIAFGLAGFNAVADWQALLWTDTGALEAVEGTVQPALVLTLVAAAVAAVLAALAASFATALAMADDAAWEEIEDEWEDGLENDRLQHL